MSIQELVPNIELCRELKKAGFPQETCFYWVNSSRWWGQEPETLLFVKGHRFESSSDLTVGQNCGTAAPTAEELGRLLPEHIVIKQQLFRLTIDIDSNRRFYANYIEYKNVNTPSNTCDLSVFEHDKSVFGIYQDAFYQEGLHVGGSNKLSDVLSHMYLYLKSNNLL